MRALAAAMARSAEATSGRRCNKSDGTPTGIADTLEQWFVEGAADGYNVLPAHFPGAFDEFVDLVVPELQRRDLYRRDYEGTTLRDHLGLAPVPAPLRQREAIGAE